MRGNQRYRPARHYGEGSIPARAGEPTDNTAAIYTDAGLSPRVRGNLPRSPAHRDRSRSIPARAGEPGRSVIGSIHDEVYPRACGGTASSGIRYQPLVGLSPRVRGNLGDTVIVEGEKGSIPARAGEPWPVLGGYKPYGVYPRACGGTCGGPWSTRTFLGLSPRVRGNRRAWCTLSVLAGSIPARAGEPRAASCRARTPPVYPRACGGTPRFGIPFQRIEGLSPRVRGNPTQPHSHDARQRSIPARAGEPPPFQMRQSVDAVYPRACGGTARIPWQ